MNTPQADEAIAPGITDEELMVRIRDRDQASFDLLFARYRLRVGKIITEILPREQDAEEAIQDVFLEVWNRAGSYDEGRGKALGWIICMARRRAIDHYRKIRRRLDTQGELREDATDRWRASPTVSLARKPSNRWSNCFNSRACIRPGCTYPHPSSPPT